eukprot:TRINITY_DN8666_c0_g1_i4.p1 TRINITY_DN8666_c0_g1~~TRINITY_DN8666_c0_g1_i4.p1  ORF type:complete len:244 (-),score=46.44 TRINITY_DN8666_c0_g1_i4:39-770(-)
MTTFRSTSVRRSNVAYKGLLAQGYTAENIVFGGDSAGGGLVVATIAAARDAGIAMPAGGIQISPWMDMTDMHTGSWTDNQKYDYLPRDFALWLAKEYAGERTLEEISPCNVSLEGFPPLMVEVGSVECLHDQVVAFTAKAREAGVDVTEYVEPGMVHVFPLYAAFAKEDQPPNQAFHHIKDFVIKVLGPLNPKTTYGSTQAEARSTVYSDCSEPPGAMAEGSEARETVFTDCEETPEDRVSRH